MCDMPDAHEGPEEARFCDNVEHMACAVGTVGCSSPHDRFNPDCEVF